MINLDDNTRQVKRYAILYKISMIALLISFVSLFILKYPYTLYIFVSIISALVACTITYGKKLEFESIRRFEEKLNFLFPNSTIKKDIKISDDKNKGYIVPYFVEDHSKGFAIDICYENGIIYLSKDKKKLEIDRKGTKKLKKMKKVVNPNLDLNKAVKLLKKKNIISSKFSVETLTIFISDNQILRLENEHLITFDSMENILVS